MKRVAPTLSAMVAVFCDEEELFVDPGETEDGEREDGEDEEAASELARTSAGLVPLDLEKRRRQRSRQRIWSMKVSGLFRLTLSSKVPEV